MKKVPDFVGHMTPPEGKRRAWLDKLAGEGIRLALVLVLTLAGAYLALHREDVAIRVTLAQTDAEATAHIKSLQTIDRNLCNELNKVRENQQVVLLSLLSLTDVLDDRPRANLQPVPKSLRTQVFQALSNLPDQRKC